MVQGHRDKRCPLGEPYQETQRTKGEGSSERRTRDLKGALTHPGDLAHWAYPQMQLHDKVRKEGCIIQACSRLCLANVLKPACLSPSEQLCAEHVTQPVPCTWQQWTLCPGHLSLPDCLALFVSVGPVDIPSHAYKFYTSPNLNHDCLVTKVRKFSLGNGPSCIQTKDKHSQACPSKVQSQPGLPCW